MNDSQAVQAESDEDFQPDKSGAQKRWVMEFAAARRELKKWQTQGRKIVKRYLDEREKNSSAETRWNLFPSNVDTLKALLYGKTPAVDVTRRFSDSQDDIARVSAMVLQRMLNADLERNNDGYKAAMEYALEDHLLPGLGNVKLRYVCEMRPVPGTPAQTEPVQDEMGQPSLDEAGQPQVREVAPAIPPSEEKANEDVETDYVFWEDQLWSPARTFHLVRWWAFKNPMSRKELVKRFGKELGRRVPLNSKKTEGRSDTDAQQQDPWGRAEVWEIWDRESGNVFWFHEGMDRVLDIQPDPLGLEGFWPFPRPMVANATTSKLVPRPDFVMAQDLYDEIDSISTRITLIERAIKVAGVYDKKAGAVGRLLSEAVENELIPVENWALFDAGGKLEGSIAWLPLEAIIEALNVLRQYRTELVSALFQITGMSDIMRGEAQQTATATEQAIKARFGSVRVQRRQDEFARFCSDVQRLRGEIICKHFDPETIIARSNILQTPDRALAQEAVAFLQSDSSAYRIVVKPESVSLTDYAALKQERSEVIQTVAGYMQAVAPLAQQIPGASEYLLEILQWLVAGVRGGSEIQGTLERAGAQAKAMAQAQAARPPAPPPPDPKIIAAKVKADGDVQKTAAATQGRLLEIKAETQAEKERRTHDAGMTILEDEAADRSAALHSVASVTGQTPGGIS